MVGWCSDNNLELNVSKTKEMIVDFRKKKTPLSPLFINGQSVERVDSFKFLGTIISSNLKWDENIQSIISKAQQRLYFLRQLKKFQVSKSVLSTFFRAVIESVLTFSITVWYSNAGQKDKKRLENIVRSASKITGCDLPSVASIFEARLHRKTRNIILDTTHPANHLFQPLPSGKRYRSIRTNTSRFRNSLYPTAVTSLSASAGLLS